MGEENMIVDEELWIEETKDWYISDEVLKYLDLTITISIHGLLSIAGVVSNIVNMVIFVKLGLKNSMSVGLFTLSLTDFLVTAFQVAMCSSNLVQKIYQDSPIDPWMLGGYMFSWARYVAYLISCWITTIMSAERCFCVVFPFRVRQVFTKSRCILAIVAIYVVHVAIHLPIFVYAKLDWVALNKPDLNVSLATQPLVLTVSFNEDSVRWEILADMTAGVGLSFLSQIILIVCTLWMIFTLKQSSMVRLNAESYTKLCDPDSNKTSNKRTKENLSQRERTMAKTILLLAIIVSICNIPRFITTGVHHILPGMNRKAFQNLDNILWEISYFFGTACCTCNIFIYVKLNSNFRNVVKRNPSK